METGMEVGAISEAHPNVGAHGGVGQQGSTLPFLSIGTDRCSFANMYRTYQYLSSFVAVPLDMSSCEYFKLSKH
jgi:hypothetical protein